MAKRKETEFDKLARLIKEEGEDIRETLGDQLKRLDIKIDAVEKRLSERMDIGFALINRRLDTVIQLQLDDHARRIKKLETAMFAK